MAAKGKAPAKEQKGAEILKGTFKRGSPTLDKELEAFSAKLEALKKQMGFSHFIRAVKDEGEDMVVLIFAAGEQPSSATGKATPGKAAPPPAVTPMPVPPPPTRKGDSFEAGGSRAASMTGGKPRTPTTPPAVLESSQALKDDLGKLLRGKKRA